MRRRLVVLAGLAVVGGCVAPRTPPPARPPAATPAPAPAPGPPALSRDWRDWPAAPGTWLYRPDPGGSRATFGPANEGARLTLRCDLASRSVTLSLAGAAGAAGAMMMVRTSSADLRWPVSPDPASVQLAATRAAADTGLDAIAFSRGRFVVEVPGTPPLVVPVWAEVARVIEDCRG